MPEVAQTGVAPVRLIDEFKAAIGKQVADVLPAVVTPERFLRTLAFAVSQNRDLMDIRKTNMQSLCSAAMNAAVLGLVPNTPLGECYLIAFKGQVQCIPGYRGLIALARRSGMIESMVARVVYVGEEFSYEEGRDRPIHHIPNFDTEVEGERRFPYALTTFKGGGQQACIVPRWKVLKIRNASLSKLKDWQQAKSPWVTEESQMWAKTAVRAAFKMLPVSTDEVQRAMEMDMAAANERGEILDAEAELMPQGEEGAAPEATPVQKQAERIKAALKGSKKEAPAPNPDALLARLEALREEYGVTPEMLATTARSSCGKALSELTNEDIENLDTALDAMRSEGNK